MAEQKQQFTQEDFLAMMQMFAEQQNKTMMDFAAKLKEPDEFTKEKQEKERRLNQENRRSRLQAAVDTERQKEGIWLACQHKKTSPGVKVSPHAWQGQVNSDGHFRPQCCRCNFVTPKIRATDEQIRNGTGLAAIEGLNIEILLNWHFRTVPDCKECAKGECAKRWMRLIKQGHLDPAPEITPDGKIRAEEAIAAIA